MVDPDQLKQAVDNLLRNAIDASPDGGRVRLEARREAADHVIDVVDEGPGIPADIVPKIFDLYFTTKADGTGVGLAVTHQIVEAHQGRIDVDSSPGRGTRMSVRIPVNQEAPAVAERVVLVVDDEAAQRTVLAGFLRKRQLEALTAGSVDEAVQIVSGRTIDLVLTDLNMPGKDGLTLIDSLRAINPELPVIVMTAFGTVASAVDAMKRGASDYLTKPIDLDELDVLVARTLERRALVSENALLKEQLASRYRLAGLETANAKMSEAINTAARAAASRATILVRGESGTGKELMARAIHYASPRAKSALVAVNVGALPDTLIESELFGHERGAFTGADRERRGRFELADGGTLFLDEIGDLPRTTQVKLLRVLQEQAFERLGGSRTIKVDVRMIAATNRDLPAMVRAGEFREDLFYRLNVVCIELPPLRERREDIPLLVDVFLRSFAGEAPGRSRRVARGDGPAAEVPLSGQRPGAREPDAPRDGAGARPAALDGGLPHPPRPAQGRGPRRPRVVRRSRLRVRARAYRRRPRPRRRRPDPRRRPARHERAAPAVQAQEVRDRESASNQ